MKSSDLKVIAIILSIALFFTIVTSNAVSVASIVMLAKGGTGTTVQGGGTQTPVQGGTDTPVQGGTDTPVQGGTDTPAQSTDPTTPQGGTSATPQGGSSATPQGGSSATPQGGSSATPQGGSTQNGWTTQKVFDFYKTAVLKVKNNGAAGHTRLEWQEVTKDVDLGNSLANSALKPIIKGFMKGEDAAEPSVSAKGSKEAKDRMCPCGSSVSYVASAKKEDVGSNYKITIVMKDEVTPAKGSAGVASMATGILYLDDVKNTIANDSTVSKFVKSLTPESKITYKAYTIVAVMTKDGKFVSIEHSVLGDIAAGADTIFGTVSGTGALTFHSKWSDFKY